MSTTSRPGPGPRVHLHLRGWAAWAPGVQDEAAWRSWSRAPSGAALGSQGQPDVGYLPAMLRRRCTRLSRMMLHAAFQCCPADARSGVRSVFASRHGGINDALPLIDCVARGEPVSPARFSHSVHNAQAGLFSIAAGNREASSAVSGMRDTFGAGVVEALTLLERAPESSVLLVVGDEPLPETMAPFVKEPDVAWATALWLAPAGADDGAALSVELASPEAPAPDPDWPDALEWVRWQLSPEPVLETRLGPRCLRWTRRRPEAGPSA